MTGNTVLLHIVENRSKWIWLSPYCRHINSPIQCILKELWHEQFIYVLSVNLQGCQHLSLKTDESVNRVPIWSVERSCTCDPWSLGTAASHRSQSVERRPSWPHRLHAGQTRADAPAAPCLQTDKGHPCIKGNHFRTKPNSVIYSLQMFLCPKGASLYLHYSCKANLASK